MLKDNLRRFATDLLTGPAGRLVAFVADILAVIARGAVGRLTGRRTTP